jgi:hypothetical protein
MTIGIDAVDRLAAKVAAGLAATITSTFRRTSSAARSPNRSVFPSASRHSMVRFSPSTYPTSRRLCRKSSGVPTPQNTDSEYLPRLLRLGDERPGEKDQRQDELDCDHGATSSATPAPVASGARLVETGAIAVPNSSRVGACHHTRSRASCGP